MGWFAGVAFHVRLSGLPPLPPDKGQPRFKSLKPTWADYWHAFLAGEGALQSALVFPHASEALMHYIHRTGKALRMDVTGAYAADKHLHGYLDTEGWEALIEAEHSLSKLMKQGKALRTRLVGQWAYSTITSSESLDWYMTLRGYGFILAMKAKMPGDNPCKLDVKLTATIAKAYDFDKGEHFGFGLPPGTAMQRLHATGLARNYLLWGKLSPGWVQLCTIPSTGPYGGIVLGLTTPSIFKFGDYLKSKWNNSNQALGFPTAAYSR